MDRRSLLKLLLAGLALPPALAAAEELSRREAWRLEELRAAWERAARADRPLLLIVIPEDRRERGLREQAWGELFTHGGDEVIAALSLAEVATATEADLARLLPDYEPQTPVPVLVRVAGRRARWRAWSAELPDPDIEVDWYGTEEGTLWQSEANKAAMRGLTEQLLSVHGRRSELIQSRRAALPAELTAEEEARFWRELAPELAPLREEEERLQWELLVLRERPFNEAIDARIAALTRAVMAAAAPDPKDLRAALAEERLSTRRAAPIPGARWGRATGCGVRYEEPDPIGDPAQSLGGLYLCGMGYVPERSARFLDFLIDEP